MPEAGGSGLSDLMSLGHLDVSLPKPDVDAGPQQKELMAQFSLSEEPGSFI
jgi:hypothetical protein